MCGLVWHGRHGGRQLDTGLDQQYDVPLCVVLSDTAATGDDSYHGTGPAVRCAYLCGLVWHGRHGGRQLDTGLDQQYDVPLCVVLSDTAAKGDDS